MPEQQLRSYRILAAVQAAIGGLTAMVVFALYGLRPNLLPDIVISMVAAALGALGAVYFVTIHQALKRNRLAFSTLILTIVTAINFILVIASTGGLDSPYYSLWLLAIVVTGIFGRAETIGVVGVTLAFYVYAMLQEGIQEPFMNDHVIQLAITLAAGGLAMWVHSRGRRQAASSRKLDDLSGKLTAEQLKAETIIASIGEGVMVIDGSRKVQIFNKAAQVLTGWDEASASGIDGSLVLALRTSDDKELDKANDPFTQSWKQSASIVRNDLIMTPRSGHKIQLNISVSPMFDEAKQPSGAIALFRDISQEKEVERQKDEFVSTASHEMRTPVAAIEGYISLAMNPNVATVDDRAQKYLGKAHDTITHLGELFRDLLSVTKAEEGQLGGKIEPVNLGLLLQGAIDDMQFTAQNKKLTLVYQIGDQAGKAIAPLYYVAANPERLREVIMNLIENAIKFTLEGGIKVTLEGDEKEVIVGVSDSGVGIATADMPHLFQKFYRIDNSATRTIGGTGLGLYLCRRVIELFNGRIWVESKPNSGSTFKFSLPRMTQAEFTRLQALQPAAHAPDEPALAKAPITAEAAVTNPSAIPMPVPNETGVSSTEQHRIQ